MSKDSKEGKAQASRFKMPNTYVILFAIIAFIAVLTWFIPGGSYELNEAGEAIAGTYHAVESNPQGLWDVLMAPVIGMLGSKTISGAIAISLTILLFGSFLEMMDRTGALKTAIKLVTAKNQRNMHMLIAILTIIMAFFGTLEGAYEEGIVYFLMFVPVILALGLDTVVAIMIVVLGTQIGCLSSVVNPFATGIASGIAGISAGEGMLARMVMFVLFTGIVIVIICRYADMVKAHPERSVQHFRRQDDLREFPVAQDEDLALSGRQKAALGVFVATFAIMIVGLIPWTSLNEGWTFFDDLVTLIGATPVLRQALGVDITPFGSWYFPELSMLVMAATLVIGAVMRYDIDSTIDTLLKGAAGLVSTAFVVPLARGIQVVMDQGQITPSILHAFESALASLPPVAFVIVALACYFLIACLIPSSTGLAAATMGIMGSLSQFAGVEVYIMVIIYLMALGLAKMITPCSIVVMTCTASAHMSYADWVRKAAPIVALLFACCCVFLCVLVLI
ncbi:YfcC family protein [Eggerthellaceae bacterium zg-1084]|uniref:YfcC family protein n=1 Tax=Berryella wangjianweii TaxID=2734634 RepID=A0A6M8JAM0_9ACTN|nr:YfcC family protein [Berryella wangjianweii]NPD31495.1 YfcC family protein [Berryella wangjianweii]QKF07882.1 YfcC family protein [Berryella wangjianweii]